jgi:hypothetical protein
MRRQKWLLPFIALSGLLASGQTRTNQHSVRPPGGDCTVLDGTFGPIRCPNGSSCGSYYTPQTQICNEDNEDQCQILEPESFCCGKYNIYIDPGDPCGFAEMRDPRVRSRLLELAEDNEILVPTCRGAYLPATVALRGRKEKVGGAL